MRPFFLDPVTQKGTAKKRYYDVASYLATQLVFSFTTAPFLILGFGDCVKAWARVYFYGVLSVVASMALFASPPARAVLRSKLEEHNARAGVKLKKSASTDSLTGREPVMGLSADLERDLDEAVQELRTEIEARQRASTASNPKKTNAAALR